MSANVKINTGNYVKPNHVMSELSKYMLVDGFDFVLDIDKSKGAYLVDSRNGEKYLDFFTCFASMPLGMNHPKLIKDKFIKYLGNVSINKPSNSDIYTEVMATFVKTFFKLGSLDDFKYSFFISGGALAVENALKTAFDWKVRKNLSKGINKKLGRQIIHFEQAFHGRTGYTLSLTNTDQVKTEFFPKFDWPRITNPYIQFPINKKNLKNVIKNENKAVNQIKKAFQKNKNDIAAIIIEPIQGEGGDNHFRTEFLRDLRNLADENEALLIYDEVQTGVGITGKMWAYQNYKVAPDILCFGKKMQVCGIVVNDRIDEVPDNVFHTSSRINSTWGGNLIDMARATKYLEIIHEEKLIKNAARLGKYLKARLIDLEEHQPDTISNVRGKGLFCAFDLQDAALRDQLRKHCYSNGLIILPCGDKSIRFRPPLNITQAQLDEGLGIIRTALKKTIQ